MRGLLIATGGFATATVLMIGLLVALPRTTQVTVTARVPAMSHGMRQVSQGTGMMGAAVSAPVSRNLTIQHTLRGCHVWSSGSTRGSTMRLALHQGERLSILDQDVDAHQLVELAGPAKIHVGRPMMSGHGMTISFARTGIYRFKTRTVDMPGMGMEAKTIGPDNVLRLVVSVA